MKRAHRLLAVALVGAAVLTSAAGSVGADRRLEARPAGEDSPWPDTEAVPANVRAVRTVVRDLSQKVELMELSAARYADWEACIRGVPVSEYGDPDRQWGYLFDERNGFGMSYMPALAVDRKSRPRKEDYLFLNISRKGNCRSNPPLSGGTADPASVRSDRRRRPPSGRWHHGLGLPADDSRRQPPSGRADDPAHPPQPRAPGREHEALCATTAGGLRALRRVGIVRLVGARHPVRGLGRQVRLPVRWARCLPSRLQARARRRPQRLGRP